MSREMQRVFFLMSIHMVLNGGKISAQSQNPDTSTINSLNDRSFKIRKEFPDSAIHLAHRAISLSEKINYLPGLGDAYIRLGLIAKDRANYDEALSFYRKSLSYRLQIGNQDYIARVYNNIGIVYTFKGSYDSAIYYSLKACKLAETLNLNKAQADYTMNLGTAYLKNNDFSQAINCYTQSKSLFEKLNDKKGIMQSEINLGSLYHNVGDSVNFLRSSYSAYSLAKQLNDEENKGIALGNIALAYEEINRPDSAIYFLRKSLAIKRSRQDKRKIAIDLNGMGYMFEHLTNYDSAVFYLEQSYQLSDEIGEKALIAKNCEFLANVYQLQGNYEKAFLYQKEFQLYHDSVFNESKAATIAEMQTKYETEKKEQEIQLLNKDKELQSTVISRQKIFRNALIAIAALILLTGGLYINRSRLVQRQRTLAEHKRISSELHDDIGATLSSFSITSEVIKNGINRGKPEEAMEAVEIIGNESRELMDRLGDIVWAINPRNDSFDKLILRLQNYAQRMCAGRNITLQLEVDESLRKVELPMEVRNNFFLIAKEAVNNAVKYSGCSELMIHLRQKGKSIMVDISDDGKGFDISESREGNGLRNMKQRAEDIHALFNLASSPHGGTHLTMSLDA